MAIQARARLGVYWDEHNVERRCVILEIGGRRFAVLDARTAEPVADPAGAIPVAGTEPSD